MESKWSSVLTNWLGMVWKPLKYVGANIFHHLSFTVFGVKQTYFLHSKMYQVGSLTLNGLLCKNFWMMQILCRILRKVSLIAQQVIILTLSHVHCYMCVYRLCVTLVLCVWKTCWETKRTYAVLVWSCQPEIQKDWQRFVTEILSFPKVSYILNKRHINAMFFQIHYVCLPGLSEEDDVTQQVASVNKW